MTRGRRSERGHVVLAVLICLVMATMLGMSMAALAKYDLTAADRVRNDAVAFNLAESGAERALRWLKSYGYPPMYTVEAFGGPQTFAGGVYDVNIVPDPTNTQALLKKFKVVSTGTYRGVSERLELYVRQQSFGRYAYFTDSEVSSVTGAPIWFFPGDRIRGPAHSNNANGALFNITWDPTSTSPIFLDTFTAAGSSINWAPMAPVNNSGSGGTDQFTSVFAKGVNGFDLDVDPIPLPSSANEQQVAAWGYPSGFPTADGVYVPSGGGIYIHGDASIKMSVGSGNTQVFSITQGSNTYSVTVDLNKATTTMLLGTQKVVTNGIPSGVVYCTGNVTSLSGTVADNVMSGPTISQRNAYTIVADTLAGKSITVSNNLLYQTRYDPTVPPTDPKNLKPGTLGLFARNIAVAASAPQNLEIDAVMLAGNDSQPDGSFYVSNYDTKLPTGTLKVVGGIIQKNRGPVGTFNQGNLLIATGYAKDYWYDDRLPDEPPPYFPTTGGYDILSWRRFTL